MKGISLKVILRVILLPMVLIAASLLGYTYYFYPEDLTNPKNLLAIGIAALICGSIFLFISKRASRPLQAFGQSLAAIAKGDFTVEAKVTGGEMGALADAYNASLEKVRNILKEAKITIDEIMSTATHMEDMTRHSQEASSHYESSVKESLEQSSGRISEMQTLIDSISDMLSQMSAGVEQIAANASETAGTAADTSELAHAGKAVMEEVARQMEKIRESSNYTSNVIKSLGESSETIGQIVETITGIADQTNLLALNAAIEAARAGEQGRGFAVVADEIRKLAEQAGEAAKQIGELIATVIKEVEEAVKAKDQGSANVEQGIKAVKDASAAFEKILDSITTVAQQMQEISAATQQMSASAENTNEYFKKITDMSIDNTNLAQEIAESVKRQHMLLGEIATSAEKLKQDTDKLAQVISVIKIQ